jgi:hypothetical protein
MAGRRHLTLSPLRLPPAGPGAATAALAGGTRHAEAAEEPDQHSLYPQERHFLHPSS